jgi:hypothetical protein
MSHCTGHLLKHIQRFANELKHAGCRPSGQYTIPMYLSQPDQTEALQDFQHLGRHCRENHNLYLQACNDRLNELSDLSSQLARQSSGSSLQKMMLLTEKAYDIRRSSSFRQFLQSNLHGIKRQEALVAFVGNILERLGKISKFYRAATTLTAIGMKLSKRNMAIQIQVAPAPNFKLRG